MTTLSTPGFDAETRQEMDSLVEHLNGGHADTVLLILRHLDDRAVDGELVRVEPDRVIATVRLADGTTEELRIEFGSPVASSGEAHVQLLGVLAGARAAAPADLPLTSLEAEMKVTRALPTVHGHVSDVRRLSSNMLEVTIAGFHDYPATGGDEFVYVFVDDDGLDPSYSMSDFRDGAGSSGVRGAYYTIRRARLDVGEIDLWVVDHDHSEGVGGWMARAQRGAPLALWGPRRGFEVPADATDVLLVADESGAAAVAALAESAPSSVRLTAVIETAGVAGRPPMPDLANLEVVWVDRCDDEPGTTNHLFAAVRDRVSTAPSAAFGAAESHHITAIRTHLRNDLGMASTQVSMTGYWRR